MNSLLTNVEVSRAQVGPRAIKDPRSRDYAIQTLYALKRYLESKEADEELVKKELNVIQENRHWEVLGYPNLEDYLKTETGRSYKEILGEARLNSFKAIGAMARRLGPPVNGGDRRSKNQRDNCNAESDRGNEKVYLARRILAEDEKNGTDVLERLESGLFRSVRAAAVDAGIITLKETPPLTILKRAWKKANTEQQGEFLRWISNET